MNKYTDTSLSRKYSVLLKYKVLIYIGMVTTTIYSFKTLYDFNTLLGDLNVKAISYMLIAYIISMFSLYCGIKIIDFLFDLDKDKTNK